jgi:hypothetical protein
MNTDTLRNNSNAQASNARVSSEEQGFSFRGTSRQAPAVITITFAVRWRKEPGHTVYRLCLSVGEKPASSAKVHRKHN